jgi:hypothetical protein
MSSLLSIIAFGLALQLPCAGNLQAGTDTTGLPGKAAYWAAGGHALSYSLAMAGLYQLWYKGYPMESFHWFNDNEEWLQMDKAGHFYSAYYLNKLCHRSFRWAGLEKPDALLYANLAAFAYIGSIELFDGFSANWGASPGDLAANAAGLLLYTVQQWVWDKEAIIPKFSYHPTPYPDIRPELLGSGWHESLVKDYNGQTYWLSFNLQAISGLETMPSWLCLSAGYSAEGMIGGRDNDMAGLGVHFTRQRQYLLSLDLDLARIPVKNKRLKIVLETFNVIKIPFPAIVFYSPGKSHFHWLYF